MQWIVCQIGAREHYAVARALRRRGQLAALVTDWWSPPRSWTRLLPEAKSLAGRYAGELSDARVLAPNVRMLFFAARAQLGRWSLWKKILAENALFQKEATKMVFDGALGAKKHVLFSYSYAARELFREAKKRGWTTVLGQIDPGPGEQRLVDELRNQYPQWVNDGGAVPPASYWDEWREECDLADRIVVNSEWSKSLLIKEGIAAAKIDVVPLAYEAGGLRSDEWRVTSDEFEVVGGRKIEAGKNRKYPAEFTRERPMRVLFLGQANVRKGIQDLVEAARLLGDGPWCFDVVGRHSSLPSGIPRHVRFHGQVPRSEAGKWYDEADVFLLPTHSDGFALTQIEAMAHGLPVVTTRCCGEVVRDGVNGILVPAGDTTVLAGAIRELAQQPRRLEAMSRAARETVREFDIDRVGRGLLEVATKTPGS